MTKPIASQPKRSGSSRREFLQTTALAGAGFWVAGGLQAQESKSPNERIQFACVGVGGKGSSDSGDAGGNGDVVAVCDIDENTLRKASASFKNAKQYYDFRKMFDEMEDKIDAVTVSTPDHTHAVVTARALRLKKHCFTQKPLTHSIYEARTLQKLAKEAGVATQMGNQGTSEAGLRKAAAMIKKGCLGTVKEVHVWTNRPIWPQGGERPAATEVPAHVHWEEWLGPAKFRPYAPGYHAFAWRGWWDFGTGALGDMACHTANMAFAALDLKNPISVEAETSGHNKDSYPKWSQIKFEFPATSTRPALTLYWYDGGKKVPAELLDGEKASDSGSLLVGEKGKLYSPNDYGAQFKMLGGAQEVEADYVKSPGHFKEWVEAIKGGKPAMSNFADYSGPLSETILLGNLAVYAGTKVEWDSVNLKAVGMPELDPIIKHEYRAGYEL